MNKRLYVGNVPYRATEADIKDLFSQAGEVISVKLLTDAATGRMRGFGFVEMATEAAAQKAVEMFNKYNFMQRNIIVSEAKPQSQKRQRQD